MCRDALAEHPDDLELRVFLARALVALRQDNLAERELGEILRREPGSSVAFQLLGEIAYRRDDLGSAEIYFRESWRLDPGNASARIWLDVALTAARCDAPPCGAGRDESGQLVVPEPAGRRRFAKGTDPQLAAYTRASDETRVGRPRARSQAQARGSVDIRSHARPQPPPVPDDRPHRERFGGYLVDNGLIQRHELARVLVYHRQHKVRVGEAAVALGLLPAQKLDWAVLGFHCRQPD